MEILTKEVFFDRYCSQCAHYREPEYSDTCNECLDQPWNENSHKPINFKPKDKKVHIFNTDTGGNGNCNCSKKSQ